MMSSETVRRIDPVLARFDADVRAGQFRSRYDPAGDILTVVFARPDSPLTTHDRQEGVYIDVDPDDPRITAITVLNYRSRFLPRHTSQPTTGPLELVRTRILLILDRLGLGASSDWAKYAANAPVQEALRHYRELIRSEPERLNGLGFTPASA